MQNEVMKLHGLPVREAQRLSQRCTKTTAMRNAPKPGPHVAAFQEIAGRFATRKCQKPVKKRPRMRSFPENGGEAS
jgi:hypothetical protein